MNKEGKIDAARRTIERYERIRTGHIWYPPGWGNWFIHVAAGEFDDNSLCAEAVCMTGSNCSDRFKIAFRVTASELFDEINDAIAELRLWRPDALAGELENLPLPGLDLALAEKITQDVAELSYVKYCEAIGVMRHFGLWHKPVGSLV